VPVVVVGVFPVLEPNIGAPDGADPNREPEDAPVEAGAPKVKLDMAIKRLTRRGMSSVCGL